jgi:hypothetical protein
MKHAGLANIESWNEAHSRNAVLVPCSVSVLFLIVMESQDTIVCGSHKTLYNISGHRQHNQLVVLAPPQDKPGPSL